jgi:hypothetical protein
MPQGRAGFVFADRMLQGLVGLAPHHSRAAMAKYC